MLVIIGSVSSPWIKGVFCRCPIQFLVPHYLVVSTYICPKE
jgi:hypothetical protein